MKCHGYEIDGRFAPTARKAAAKAKSIARLKKSMVRVYKVCGNKEAFVLLCSSTRCIRVRKGGRRYRDRLYR